MSVRYVIKKMKGAFYAGSEKIAEKGLALKRYLSLDSVSKMVKALHLSASSILFEGVSKAEQNKILGKKSSSPKKASKAKKKAKKKKR